MPDALVGDPDRLRQVLINLVGNAIKFTARGEVVVAVEPEQEGRDGVVLHFRVSDTGIGIPPKKQRAIFEPFEQADTSTTRQYGGTGLGLAISARLVALMGGKMWVESEVGQGSTFHFTASFGRQPEDASGGAGRDLPRLEGLPILVVDDNATNRRILEEVLSNWGVRPVAVDSGPEALRTLRAATRRGEPFAAALIDGMMPEMDGFGLAEHIRAEPEIAATALLMLTSAGRPEDPECLKALRIAAFLIKPVRQSELFEALMKALVLPDEPSETRSRGSCGGVENQPDGDRAAVGLRVLLAEDHPINQKVAVRMLEKMGHSVVVAADGRQALEAIEADRFDVVLMDVQMPVMDGFEAVRAIRAGGRDTAARPGHRSDGPRDERGPRALPGVGLRRLPGQADPAGRVAGGLRGPGPGPSWPGRPLGAVARLAPRDLRRGRRLRASWPRRSSSLPHDAWPASPWRSRPAIRGVSPSRLMA